MAEEKSRIICGHVLDVLADFDDDTFQVCVTSPPYWGKRQYGGPQARIWGGNSTCEHDWEEQKVIHDNLRYRGKNASVGSDKNPKIRPHGPLEVYHDKVCHRIGWCASVLCRKCQAWRGALGQEPTPELYVQHLVTIFAAVKRVLCSDGTLWLNIGDSYVSGKRDTKGVDLSRVANSKESNHLGGWHTQVNRQYDGLPRKNLVGLPWLTAFALRDAGWILRCDIIWEKPNGKPESVKDRPTITHEYLFLLSAAAKYYYDADAIREPHQTKPKRKRKAKTNLTKNEKAINRTGNISYTDPLHTRSYHPKGRNKRSVWTISTEQLKDEHYAPFPRKLVEPCILAGSKPGDLVLDPFIGSGTTAMVAETHDRNYVGIDVCEEYCEMARRRIAKGLGQEIKEKPKKTQLTLF